MRTRSYLKKKKNNYSGSSPNKIVFALTKSSVFRVSITSCATSLSLPNTSSRCSLDTPAAGLVPDTGTGGGFIACFRGGDFEVAESILGILFCLLWFSPFCHFAEYYWIQSWIKTLNYLIRTLLDLNVWLYLMNWNNLHIIISKFGIGIGPRPNFAALDY